MDYRSKLELDVINLERSVVYLIYKDYNNYTSFRYSINSETFLKSEHRSLYNLAEILYEKYNYNSLSTDLVRDLINNNNRYTTEEINEINFNLDLININVDLDVKGTFTLYLKNLGLLKILNTFTKDGEDSFEVFLNNLSEIENDPIKIKELFNFIIDDSFKVINNKIQESSFIEGIDDIFSKLLEGRVSQGLKLNNTPILNYMTSGFHEGVTYFGGYSGTGKTTYCVPMFLLPILNAEDEEGNKHEKILIIANEQNKEVFMTIMGLAYISFVLNRHRNEFSYETKNRYVSRKHINENMLTDEEKETLIDVKEYIKEDLKNRVQFIFMPSFDPKEIEMYLLKYSRMGYKNVFIDTMKAETKGEYHLMSNLSQMLDRVSKENNLRILATVQLALHTYGRKYLDHTCIAEAKSIVEIAEVSLYFREVEISEIRSLSVQKFDYSQNKYIDVQSKIEDPKYNEKYILLFIGKNRHGKDKKIILYRSNFDKVWFTEIGEVSGLSYDGGK